MVLLHMGINSLSTDIKYFHVQQLKDITQPSESDFSNYVNLNENLW